MIDRKVVEKLRRHASREFPREACGVLAGKDGAVTRVYECRNVSGHPEVSYEISPEDLLKAMEDMKCRGLELLGFYHSHPAGLSRPSLIDEGRATWPGYSYVIVSPSGSISSWRWNEEKNRFEEEAVSCYSG